MITWWSVVRQQSDDFGQSLAIGTKIGSRESMLELILRACGQKSCCAMIESMCCLLTACHDFKLIVVA